MGPPRVGRAEGAAFGVTSQSMSRVGQGLWAAALSLAACAPTSQHTPARGAQITPAAPPAAPKLDIPERLAVFSAASEAASTPRWALWLGARWPEGERVIGFFSRSERRFERLSPGSNAAASAGGAVLTIDTRPLLFPASGAAPIALPRFVTSAAFSPDGARILAAESQAWVLLDAADGRQIAREGASTTPVVDSVQWGREALFVGYPGYQYLLRAADLKTLLDGLSGPLSPDGSRVIDVSHDVPDTPPAKRTAFRVYDTRTGKELHVVRGDRPSSDRSDTAEIHWSADGRRIWWLAGALRVLDTATKRVTSIAPPALGEPDGESKLAAAPTADGSRACFALRTRDASYDLARRAWLRDQPDRAVRCAIEGHEAVVVEVPLAAGEEVEDLPAGGFGSWFDVVLSKDRARAAALVAPKRVGSGEARPMSLVILDVAGRRVAHRVPLGEAWGAALERSPDGAAVDVDVSPTKGDHERRRVSFESGAVSHATSAAPPAAPPPPPFLARRMSAQIAGATVLWSGPDRTFAHRLDGEESRAWAGAPCASALSPSGWVVLRVCEGAAEIASLRGGPSKPSGARRADAIAVSDDGRAALGRGGDVVIEGGASPRFALEKASGSFTKLRFSRDGRHLVAWHEGGRTLHLLDVRAPAPRWSRALTGRRVRDLRFSEDGADVIVDGVEAFPIDGAPPHTVESPAPEALELGLGELPVRLAGSALVAKATEEGAVRLHDASSRALVATLVPVASGRVIALFADGRVDWLGAPAPSADVLCTRGHEVVAPERCAPLLDLGALRRAF